MEISLRRGRQKSTQSVLAVVLGIAFFFSCSRPAQAQQSASGSMTGTLKAFVLTSTYGVIAGSLTGLASLAFYDKASEHTRNIAMGASIGLYTGILLGAYIVYGPMMSSGPNEEKSQEEEKKEDPNDPINLGADLGPRVAPTLSYLPQSGVQLGVLYRF